MSYHRNFEFRVSPRGGQRAGRFYVEDATLIGAPVKLAADADPHGHELGLAKVELATGAQAPKPGVSGICVYEFKGADGWAGDDPHLTTFSDKDTVPAGAAVQVVSGDTVKVAFRNTDDVTFLNARNYEGRTMVAELGATPAVSVGDYLTPGVGSDAAGYWAKTTDATQAWLVVTGVDPDRGEVEARMLF
jgi:hypothetical protein